MCIVQSLLHRILCFQDALLPSTMSLCLLVLTVLKSISTVLPKVVVRGPVLVCDPFFAGLQHELRKMRKKWNIFSFKDCLELFKKQALSDLWHIIAQLLRHSAFPLALENYRKNRPRHLFWPDKEVFSTIRIHQILIANNYQIWISLSYWFWYWFLLCFLISLMND